MSVGTVAMSDPLLNFFKVVEAARQRNVTAFSRIQPAAKLEEPKNVNVKKSASTTPLNRQFQNKIMGVNRAPVIPATNGNHLRTKMVGNFFDAYA